MPADPVDFPEFLAIRERAIEATDEALKISGFYEQPPQRQKELLIGMAMAHVMSSAYIAEKLKILEDEKPLVN